MSDLQKVPSWQWIAGIAMTGLMFFSSVLLLAALSDIKEGRATSAKLDLRVTTIEQIMPLQFNAISEWRNEMKIDLQGMKTSLNQIAGAQNKTAELLTKSAVTLDQWKKIK